MTAKPCGNCEGTDPASCLACGPRLDTKRDERLRGIWERAAAATEGPWTRTGGPHSDLVVQAPAQRFVATTGNPHYNDGRTGQLARAHGRSLEAERVAQGSASDPRLPA